MCTSAYIATFNIQRYKHTDTAVTVTQYPINARSFNKKKIIKLNNLTELRHHQEHQLKHYHHCWKIQNWDTIPIAYSYEKP